MKIERCPQADRRALPLSNVEFDRLRGQDAAAARRRDFGTTVPPPPSVVTSFALASYAAAVPPPEAAGAIASEAARGDHRPGARRRGRRSPAPPHGT